MGRTPTPTRLKLVKGNPGRRPINRREPQPTVAIPPCPRWLDPKAKTLWRHLTKVLHEIQVLTLADARALELVCEAYAEWRAARAVIRRRGPSYETETAAGGLVVRSRPEVAIAADAWRRVRQGLTDFGLTPASRTKLTTVTPEAVDPVEEFLTRGKTS